MSTVTGRIRAAEVAFLDFRRCGRELVRFIAMSNCEQTSNVAACNLR